jgi:hypothetical protein
MALTTSMDKEPEKKYPDTIPLKMGDLVELFAHSIDNRKIVVSDIKGDLVTHGEMLLRKRQETN